MEDLTKDEGATYNVIDAIEDATYALGTARNIALEEGERAMFAAWQFSNTELETLRDQLAIIQARVNAELTRRI